MSLLESVRANGVEPAMSHYLESPNGNELVCILGSGYEKNNRQALDTWVAYHRNEVFEKRLEGRSPLDFLIEKLESMLNN